MKTKEPCGLNVWREEEVLFKRSFFLCFISFSLHVQCVCHASAPCFWSAKVRAHALLFVETCDCWTCSCVKLVTE